MLNTRGNLKIPANAQILRAEPAIKYQLKNDGSVLYATQPLFPKSAIKKIFHTDFEKPVPGKIILHDGLTEDIVAQRLHKDSKVLARAFEYPDPKDPSKKIQHPDLLEVIVYEEKNDGKKDDMPESGREINVLRTGYMFKSDLFPLERFERYQQDLFASLPRTADVFQSWMPDCFFLSSVNGMLAIDYRLTTKDDHIGTVAKRKVADSNPGGMHIQNMMVQLNDGTVIVRLFHPVTGNPVFVRVEYSYHVMESQISVNHLEPFVQILEKAYAVLGYKVRVKKEEIKESKQEKDKESEEEKIEEVPGAFLTVYGAGGHAYLAMKILTGQDAQFHPIQSHRQRVLKQSNFDYTLVLGAVSSLLISTLDNDKNLQVELKNLAQDPANYEQIKEKLDDLADTLDDPPGSWLKPIEELLVQTNLYKALEGDPALLGEWGLYAFIFIMVYEKQFPDISFADLTQPSINRAIDILKTLSPAPPENVIKKFREFANQSREYNGIKIYEFPGGLLKGNYSEEETKIFADIKTRVANREIIVANSVKEFKEGNQVIKVPGLRSSHDYTVIDVKETSIPSPDGTKHLYFVKLRNPWGKTGRFYDTSKEEPVPLEVNENAEFYIDLHDFITYFKGYSTGSIPTVEALEAKFQKANADYEKEIDNFLNTKFDSLTIANKLILIERLLKTEINLRDSYLQMQSKEGLFELIDFLENEVLNEERRLLQIEPSTLRANHVYGALETIEHYRKLSGEARHQLGFKFALDRKSSRDFLQFLNDQKQKKFAANNILQQPFAALNKNQGDLPNAELVRNDFVFELVKLQSQNIEACLNQQSLPDLLQLIDHLRSNVRANTQYEPQLTHAKLKELAKEHFAAENELLAIVKAHFVRRMEHDVNQATIALNADNYLKEKSNYTWFHRFKRSVKTFFSSDFENSRKTFKRHLKFTEKYNVSEEKAQLAFDYLRAEGVPQSEKDELCKKRFAALAKSLGKSQDQQITIDKFGPAICYTIDDKSYNLDRKLVHQFATAQQAYVKQKLQQIKEAKQDVMQLAGGFVTRHAKSLHQLQLRGIGMFVHNQSVERQQRQEKLNAIEQSALTLEAWAEKALDDQKLKSNIAKKAGVTSADIEAIAIEQSADDFNLTLHLKDDRKFEFEMSRTDVEKLAVRAYDARTKRVDINKLAILGHNSRS